MIVATHVLLLMCQAQGIFVTVVSSLYYFVVPPLGSHFSCQFALLLNISINSNNNNSNNVIVTIIIAIIV